MKIAFERQYVQESSRDLLLRVYSSTPEREPGTEWECTATTKAGKPCPIPANEGRPFCHVHDPLLQCGAKRRDGSICKVATGGVHCKFHTPKAEQPPSRQRRRRYRR